MAEGHSPGCIASCKVRGTGTKTLDTALGLLGTVGPEHRGK